MFALHVSMILSKKNKFNIGFVGWQNISEAKKMKLILAQLSKLCKQWEIPKQQVIASTNGLFIALSLLLGTVYYLCLGVGRGKSSRSMNMDDLY